MISGWLDKAQGNAFLIASPIRHIWPIAATTFVRGNTVVAAVEDDAGTIMVKRYRLVLPGER